jgi:hypothetical protein
MLTADELFAPAPESAASTPSAVVPADESTAIAVQDNSPPAGRTDGRNTDAQTIEAQGALTAPADRLNAWTAASQWSLAAAMQARQAAAAQIEPVLENAQAAATALGVTLPPISKVDGEATGASPPLVEAAAGLIAEIDERCGPAEAAAARLAVESHSWLLSYTPLNPPAAETLTEVREAATASELPAPLTEPLLELVSERAAFGDVKRAIFELHREITAHLKKLVDDSR